MTHTASPWAPDGVPLDLRRWPPRDDDPLQAWDGADRHAVAAALEEDLPGPVLLVEDQWGALAAGLGGRVGACWGDDVLSRLAIEHNRAANGLPPVPWVPSTGQPPGDFASAILRVPRSVRRLRWWLARVADVLPPGAPLWVVGRAREVTRRVLSAVEAVGPADPSPQRFKSRIVRTRRLRGGAPPQALEIVLGERTLLPHPGVFGEDGIDEGSALLLEHLGSAGSRVLDLACGTGVLGAAAAIRLGAEVTFTDASFLAVDSARRSHPEGTFVVADAGDGLSQGFDLILCNPPFHAGRARTRAVAARMFARAAALLDDGGRLLVVGNRHLEYHRGLARWFRSVRVLSRHPRFAVIEAQAPRELAERAPAR